MSSPTDGIKRNSDQNSIKFYSFTTNSEFSFAAFLMDFNDQYTSNWNTQEIYGRMDPVYTFKNTVRKITLGFEVPSATVKEARENSYKADLLIRSLYPVYTEHASQKGTALISSPPMFRIRFGNLICMFEKVGVKNIGRSAKASGLLGWIDGYGFKPELDSGFFFDTVNFDGTPTSSEQQNTFMYPKLFKINFNFNVIHEHPMGYRIEPASEAAKTKIEAGQEPKANEVNHAPRAQQSKFVNFPHLYPNPEATSLVLDSRAADSITTPKDIKEDTIE